MTRTQVQQIIVIALLIAFGAVWATTRQGTAPAPSVPATTPPPDPGATPGGREPGTAPREGAGADLSLARDLFGIPSRLVEKIRDRERTLELERKRLEQQREPAPAPGETKPPLELPALELQGIFWGVDRPQAIINRRILSVGDTIEGADVAAISKEGVTLMYGEQKVELRPSTEVRGTEELSSGEGRYPYER